MNACTAAVTIEKCRKKTLLERCPVDCYIYTSESYLSAQFRVQKRILFWRYRHCDMHRSCIHCVSLPVTRSRKLLKELKETEGHRILLTLFLLRPHNLKMTASSLGTKKWKFEMSSSSCGLVFFVSLPFGERKKKQYASYT